MPFEPVSQEQLLQTNMGATRSSSPLRTRLDRRLAILKGEPRQLTDATTLHRLPIDSPRDTMGVGGR